MLIRSHSPQPAILIAAQSNLESPATLQAAEVRPDTPPAALGTPARLRRSVSQPGPQTVQGNNPRGDIGGLLTKELPLSADDRATLQETVNRWKIRQKSQPSSDGARAPRLIEYLYHAIPESSRPSFSDDPEAFVRALVNSPDGQALGKALQEALGALPTQTSVEEALFAALLLDLDPAGGEVRNNLAGYNLRQPDNWGRSPAEIVERFEQHLTALVGPQMAKVAAYQLLSVSAPEFLVTDLPAHLVYGSHQWAAFSAAVYRNELDTPGSSAGKTYARIMADDEARPLSGLSERRSQFAQMRTVIDWGIANGIVEEKSDEAYTAEDIDRSVTALNEQIVGLENAAGALSTPVPTRKELALAELRRVYGPEKESFFEKKILGEHLPGSPGRKQYSLLDIYMSGELGKQFWTSSDPGFDTVEVNLGFSKLPAIQALFDEKFEAYARGLREAVGTHFKYQLSLLPLEDRRLIEYGKVTTFSLHVPSSGRAPTHPDHAINAYVNSGAIIIRAELDGKTCHYLYSPAQGRIIKDADPSRPGLKFPGSRLYFSFSQPQAPTGKEPAVTVLWQVLGQPWPKNDPIDFAAFPIYPSKSLEAGLPGPHTGVPTSFSSAKTLELTESVAAFYTRGLDESKKASYGETEQEREVRLTKSIHAFLLGLIPFYDATKAFIDGKAGEGLFNVILDMFGFFIPGLKGGAQAVKAGVKGFRSTLTFLKGFAKAGLQAANPLAGIYDAGRGVFQLGKLGYKRLSKAPGTVIDQLRAAVGRGKSFDLPHGVNKEPVAQGIYRPLGERAEAIPVSAVERNGKWYAFDVKTQSPYGAPLKGFTPLRPGIVQVAANTAVSIAIDTAFSVASGLVYEKIRAKSIPVPTSSTGTPSVSQIEAGKEVVVDDPVDAAIEALRPRIEAARLATVEVQARADIYEALKTADTVWPDDPVDAVAQIEACLDVLEDRTTEVAQAHEVFFKAYVPDEKNREAGNGLAGRLAVVEKRLAALKQAQERVQKKLDQPAAHT